MANKFFVISVISGLLNGCQGDSVNVMYEPSNSPIESLPTNENYLSTPSVVEDKPRTNEMGIQAYPETREFDIQTEPLPKETKEASTQTEENEEFDPWERKTIKSEYTENNELEDEDF